MKLNPQAITFFRDATQPNTLVYPHAEFTSSLFGEGTDCGSDEELSAVVSAMLNQLHMGTVVGLYSIVMGDVANGMGVKTFQPLQMSIIVR